ncbi:imidazole glycerol phosphate synthase subunit HisH [Gammaproteobacteria bacterium]|jgi:glutamine amidotransferase|nr:imidazole glycerol phosphate synthase subunit HisH [Gammaproteobacteria bacterium]
MKVHIVNYGMGNIFSVQKKIQSRDITLTISSKIRDISNADKIILCGVGHFKKAMDNLHELNLIDSLNNFALIQKKPILGICLGMQLMSNFSEEGNVTGLRWIDAEVKKFVTSESKKFKIPHMGWNTVNTSKKSALMHNIDPNEEFYFVHSYYLKSNDPSSILNETTYIQKFCSGIEQENIFGVQYHPEKSHDAGKTLLDNFLSL